MKNDQIKKAALPIGLVLFGLGTSIFFIYLFAELAEVMLEDELKYFDETIIEFLHKFASETLGEVMFVFTELASLWFLTIFSLTIILYLWWKKKDKWSILFFIIAVGGGGILTKLLKYYYGRERPSINEEIDAIGYSFPSGHSMGSLIFYGFLTYFIIRSNPHKIVKRITIGLAAVLILLISISRIYLGAHYPSDIIAGHLAGGFWLILCILALEYVKWRSGLERTPIKAIKQFISQLQRGRR